MYTVYLLLQFFLQIDLHFLIDYWFQYRGPYKELQDEKCFDAYSLFVNISEPESVANNFSFQLFFRPTCNDSNSASDIASSNAGKSCSLLYKKLEQLHIMIIEIFFFLS